MIVKENFIPRAEELFHNTGINITAKGRKQLGAIVGTYEFKKEFISKKVEKWIEQIELLSKIGNIDPHSSYIAYTRCFKHKFGYIMRTVPQIESLLKPLDAVIDEKFIPSLTNGQTLTQNERSLFALHINKGGMGISIPSKLCDQQYNDSREITASLTKDIMEQNENYKMDTSQQKQIKSEIRSKKSRRIQKRNR